MDRPSSVAAPCTVTVVVCCYTMARWRLINRAIESVRQQSLPAHQIVLVVDHCPDLLTLARSEIRGVQVVANAHARGLSGARNTGVDVAVGDVVAFLDDDAMADGDWLLHLGAAFGVDESVVGVGGAVTPQWAGGERPRWFPAEYDWVVGCSYVGQPTTPGPVRNFIGANMAFRRDAVRDAGGFLEHLGRTSARPLGCEETELCIRIGRERPDAVLHYLPAAAVTHYVAPERCRWSYFVSRCYAEGQSKAAVAALTGRSPALRTERDYVRTTLPRGVRTALRGAARDPAGVARATAIVLGLFVTALGYLVGSVRRPAKAGRTDELTAVASDARRRRIVAVGTLVLALGLWSFSMRDVDLDAMNDLGLVSVLPLAYWLALALVVVGAWRLIWRGIARDRTIAAYLVTLILMLHATPSALYGSLRYSWAWKHIGIVDYVMRHGAVDPHIEQLAVYHAWPGFFALGALLTQLGGFHTALSFAAWGPPFFELLNLGPLLLLFRTFTTDRRRVWTAVLVYYLTQWVGQDYFSPQAFAYFLYLVCLVVVLRYLGASRRRRRTVDRRPFVLQIFGLERQALAAPARRVLTAGLVLLMIVMASSHQLTPAVLVIALGLLVAAGVGGPRWLPWVMAMITVGWFCWLGRTYLAANIQSIMRAFGALQSNTGATFVELGRASAEQQIVDWTDRLLSALVWPLALAGFLRQQQLDHRESVPALLALVPLPLLAANDYGGEMLFRVCLFAMPFLAYLISGLLQPPRPHAPKGALPSVHARRRRHMPARAGAALSLATVVAFAGMFVVAYDGKERMNYFTTSERAGSEWLYDTAPKGALITSVNSNYPWAFEHYEYYDYDFLEYLLPRQKEQLATDPLPVLEDFLAVGCERRTYFIVTRSQEVEVRYTASLDPRSVPLIVRAMRSTPLFRLDYHQRDVDVYEVMPEQCPVVLGGSS